MLLTVGICLCASIARGQATDTASVQNIPSKYYSAVQKKYAGIENKLTKKSLKYLAKFERQQQKLQARLARLHPETTNGLLSTEDQKYKNLTEQLKSKAAPVSKVISGLYNANLDSVSTSLSFLKQFNGISSKAGQPLQTLNELQGKLQQTDKVKEYIEQQKSQIKELLSKYTNLPAGLKNEYAKLNKTAYYYSAQVQEYKATLKDPDKMEQKALSVLREIPAFQKFMQQNGELASLFHTADNYNNMATLVGLQTRNSVQQIVQQRIAAGGPNALAQVRQSLSQADAQLNQLKGKLNLLGGSSSATDLPNFKPNSQKTKPFLKRLEYGFNIQFERNTSFVPSTTDFALTIGYKLNDNSIIGFGGSYKLGLGNIQHINFIGQGLGLRSFLDYKIKKQFYISGGYEMNYNATFKSIAQLKNYNTWQRSELLGVSKKYQISKKVKGNIQLLYDFLAHSHTPISQPFVYRVGYNF